MRNLDIPAIVFASQSETTSIYIGDEDFVVVDKSCTVILPEEVHAYTGKVITIIANRDCNVLNTEMGAMILSPRYRLTVVAIAEQWVVISFIHVPIPEPIYKDGFVPIPEPIYKGSFVPIPELIYEDGSVPLEEKRVLSNDAPVL